MKFYIIFILISLSFAGYAQKAGLLTLNELEKRLQDGSDTTYVINFWATWCSPCIKELPHFDRLQKENQDKPVKVLLISLDLPSRFKKKVIPFVKRRKISSEVFLLNEKDQQASVKRLAENWSGALPATAFINRGKDINLFFEQTFTYESLLTTIHSLNK